MSDPNKAIISAATPESFSAGRSESRRLRWFELSLVLLVACARPLLNALYVLIYGRAGAPNVTGAGFLIGVVQEVTALLLLGYVLLRRNLRFEDIGLRWSLTDFGAGLVLTCVSYAVYSVGSAFVNLLRDAINSSPHKGPVFTSLFTHFSVMAIPYFLLSPIFEELIVRAYLMTEVMDLTGSQWLAIMFSVVVQSSYHLYYGWAGAIALSFQFLTFALYYASSRRILPAIIAHEIYDIFGLIRLWRT
jgi:membrane protease YdiL (CAAX protease family)